MPQRAAQCFHFPFPPAIASSSSQSQSPSPSQLWHSLRLICRSRRRVEMSKTNASTPNFHLVNVWKCCRKNYLVVENVHILVHTTVISLFHTHTRVHWRNNNNMHLSICHVDICLAIYFPAATCARLFSLSHTHFSPFSLPLSSVQLPASLLSLFLGTVCAIQGECNAIVARNWLSYLSHTLKVNEISASRIYHY